MVSDPYKMKGATYDGSINSFIYRVYDDKTGELVNITISDRESNKENTSFISFVAAQREGAEGTEIVELNKTSQKESYKAVFSPEGKMPKKIFHKKNIDDKWQTFVNPPEEVLDYIADRRESLKARRLKGPMEANAVFIKG